MGSQNIEIGKLFKERMSSLEQTPTSGEIISIAATSESDRGYVLILAEWLSQSLEKLFRALMLDDVRVRKRVIDQLFAGYGPLASLSAKSQVAYSLGLISADMHAASELIRKIRNDFAHSFEPKSLREDPTASRIRELRCLPIFKNAAEVKIPEELLAHFHPAAAEAFGERIWLGSAMGTLIGLIQARTIIAPEFRNSPVVSFYRSNESEQKG